MPTRNEALLEAYASGLPSQRIYQTLEVWHPAFAHAARVVANGCDDVMISIEAGAPRDGGTMVTFVAYPFTADYPEQREGSRRPAGFRSTMSGASWCRRSGPRSACALISTLSIASISAAT